MEGRANFVKRSGDSLALLLRFWDDAAKTVAKDITGWQLVFTQKKLGSGGAALTVRPGVSVANTLTARLTPVQTILLAGTYAYDLVVLLPDGSEYTRCGGTITYLPRIKTGVG